MSGVGQSTVQTRPVKNGSPNSDQEFQGKEMSLTGCEHAPDRGEGGGLSLGKGRGISMSAEVCSYHIVRPILTRLHLEISSFLNFSTPIALSHYKNVTSRPKPLYCAFFFAVNLQRSSHLFCSLTTQYHRKHSFPVLSLTPHPSNPDAAQANPLRRALEK